MHWHNVVSVFMHTVITLRVLLKQNNLTDKTTLSKEQAKKLKEPVYSLQVGITR